MNQPTELWKRLATFTLSLLATCGGGGGDGTDSSLPAAADDREHAAAPTTCFTCTLPPAMPASGLPHWKQIAAGKWDSCGVTPGNVAYCWGLSNSGTGESHTCALDTARHAFCLGANNNKQPGNGGGGPYSALPVAVVGGATFATLSVGASHSCALDGAGRAYCWGYGSSGQLATTASSTPELRPSCRAAITSA